MLTAVPFRFILGMLVVLFFRCMSALFNPAHRRGERVKWGLVFYTVMMFSLVTAYTAMNLHMLSMSINHPKPRSRPGIYEYLNVVYFDAIAVIPRAVFRLTNLSADGLLVSPLFDVVQEPHANSSSFIVVTCSTP